MKYLKSVGLFLLISIMAVSLTACKESETLEISESSKIALDSTEQEIKEENNKIEITDEEEKTIVLNNTYTTKFSEVNAVTYPSFTFDYPDNWGIVQEDITEFGETVVLANERGVEITYSHIGGIGEDGLRGGSAVLMKSLNVSKVADSDFQPSYVQATDYSNLGEFMVAKLKVTGHLNMKEDVDFTEIDGSVSYAVLPKSREEEFETIRSVYTSEFSFWYSGHISFIASAPDGQFTESEEQEVIEILTSFKVVQ